MRDRDTAVRETRFLPVLLDDVDDDVPRIWCPEERIKKRSDEICVCFCGI